MLRWFLFLSFRPLRCFNKKYGTTKDCGGIQQKTSQQKQCDRYTTHQIHIFLCPTSNHIGYSNHASPASGLERCDVGGTWVGKAPSATVGAKGVVLGFNRACCIKLRSAQTSPAMRWVTTLSSDSPSRLAAFSETGSPDWAKHGAGTKGGLGEGSPWNPQP